VKPRFGEEQRCAERVKNPSGGVNDSLLLSRAEAARQLSIGLTHLDELVRSERVKTTRLGRRVLIRRRSLLELIDGGESL
jgi:excisionase family DNA binding protein